MNGPTDLRWFDLRPNPAPSASDEDVVRELLEARLDGDELTHALQMLGLVPSDASDRGRDVLARRMSKQDRERRERTQAACPKGHPRGIHSKVDKAGRPYCLTCKSDEGLARRIANAERRKRQAA